MRCAHLSIASCTLDSSLRLRWEFSGSLAISDRIASLPAVVVLSGSQSTGMLGRESPLGDVARV